MSLPTIKSTKKSLKTKQRFIRLNLDDNLDEMLAEFETKYKLLNRSDIVRMLLSEIYWAKKQSKRNNFIDFLDSLPKPDTILTEDEIFSLVEKELE